MAVMNRTLATVLLTVLPGFAVTIAARATPPVGGAGLETLRGEADALEPLVTTRLARDFVKGTRDLPAVAPRTLFLDEVKKTYLAETAAGSLAPNQRRALKPVVVDESFYYTTKYGSPLAYARPLDLLGQSGVDDLSGWRILDFGYGTIGHLRLLAGLGAEVTGVDVDPMLRALYSAPEDQGPVENRHGRDGRLRLIHGRFPADPDVRAAVGENYDLIISKNTLKRGYVHPESPVDPNRLLGLGVDDARFVRAFAGALKPGGRVLIYNICPAPSPPGEPYKHWADGRCPFPKDVWETAGFRVIAFDREDSEAIRRVAHALGWDRGESPMDLKADLFAQYSIMEKPRRPERVRPPPAGRKPLRRCVRDRSDTVTPNEPSAVGVTSSFSGAGAPRHLAADDCHIVVRPTPPEGIGFASAEIIEVEELTTWTQAHRPTSRTKSRSSQAEGEGSGRPSPWDWRRPVPPWPSWRGPRPRSPRSPTESPRPEDDPLLSWGMSRSPVIWTG
jgi:SAM-dependent methyltransferase